MILLHWCLKNVTFKEYKLIDLVNIMLQTVYHPHEKNEMKQYVASHGTNADHFRFCFGLLMTLREIPFASSW